MRETSYAVNEGPRSEAVRVGMEVQMKAFIVDYANDMGTSESAASRRLILIGARCEAEHGNTRMPASYGKLFYNPEERSEDADLTSHAILEENTSSNDDDWMNE